ncbi:Maf family protein [Planctomycetota bacterium]|nr:Maf family protein [Planctomycetota bacterium]
MNFKADHNTRLILASRSPRRAQLLADAGFTAEQISSPFVDPPQPELQDHDSALELSVALAMEKAKALAPEIEGRAVLIAADTICVDDQSKLIGTPTTRDEAFNMIKTFSSSIHYVITGVCVLAVDEEQPNEEGQNVRAIAMSCFGDEAIVMLGHLTDEQINEYLDLNTWQGKAGGYNLTERQEAGWPIIVNGEPTTVTGLPIQNTIKALSQFSIEPQSA